MGPGGTTRLGERRTGFSGCGWCLTGAPAGGCPGVRGLRLPRTLVSMSRSQEAGLQGWDEMDVVRSALIEWRGGGPEAWAM